MVGADPSASVTFPPEILEKIFEHIPTDERQQTLIACASVASWWTGPCQRRLFSSVFIREDKYERWMNDVVLSGSKARLLEYVRSLWHCRGVYVGIKYPMQDLPRDSGRYLSGLRNLHTLTLYNITIDHISEEGFHTCFSAFRDTLTYLSLETFATSFSAFVTLVDYFPNLRTLKICALQLEPDGGPVPSLSRPLRGGFHVYTIEPDCLEFLNRFAKLDLEYDELVISSPFLGVEAEFLESALQISANTVKSLRLTAELDPGATPTISNFRQLRELELVVSWLNSSHMGPLSSITSTDLQKIIFPANYMVIFPQRAEQWDAIDKELCRLVDRLCATGYHHILEVELRFTEVKADVGKHDFTKFLPKFREKGVVTVIDAVHNDRILHSSTQNR